MSLLYNNTKQEEAAAKIITKHFSSSVTEKRLRSLTVTDMTVQSDRWYNNGEHDNLCSLQIYFPSFLGIFDISHENFLCIQSTDDQSDRGRIQQHAKILKLKKKLVQE